MRSRGARREPARGGEPRAAAAGAITGAIAKARTIIYVHGIGNKPIASILKCQWDRALFGFDLGERSRVAYWVNREHYPEPSPETCGAGDLVRLEEGPAGRAPSAAAAPGVASLEEEIAALTDRAPERDALLRLASQLESGAARGAETGPRALGVEARVLPLPEGLRRWITRQLTRLLLRDVHEYLFVAGSRERMEGALRERLRAGGGPFVVIGHSQGSMIAYSTLAQLSAEECEVPLFVTLGSPLGLQEIQDQLKELLGAPALAVPACVGQWVNVADALDPVALDKGLRGEFASPPAIEDYDVRNPDGPRHPHSATGYLRSRPVLDAVRDAVDGALFQPVADFVLARDVARLLEDGEPDHRHPILIELGEPAAATERTLDAVRAQVLELIGRVAPSATPAELRVQPLQRFVGADLTRAELEAVASALTVGPGAVRERVVRRVWRNGRKCALLETTIDTVQARPAHCGYRARGRDIHWAILDSGIASHPHFERFGNIVAQHDCTGSGSPTDGPAGDEHGHGTHVAGIVAGWYEHRSANGSVRTVCGMAPEAKLHIYKVLDRRGQGEDAWIIKALDHISSLNERGGRPVIHGVNLSLGGPFDQSVYGCGHSPLCAELRRLWRQGVVVVLAAGNEGFAVLQSAAGPIDANLDLSVGDPANLEEAIAVGSVHKENPHTYGISYFSSRGPTADGRQKPDLVAPGERVLSCRKLGPDPPPTAVPELYVEMSGTSMAAPHVSGIIAAYLSIRREFVGYPDLVKEVLLANCTDLKRDRPQQGSGMPNLVKMLVNT